MKSTSLPPSAPETAGVRLDAKGVRVTALPPGFVAGLQYVLQRGRPGAASRVLQPVGRSLGRQIAAVLDAHLVAQGQPRLAQRTASEGLEKLGEQLSALGWGKMEFEQRNGLVVARMKGSYWAGVLADSGQPADAMVTGLLQGFLEHIRGTPVAGLEIGCVRGGEQHCTFVAGPAHQIDELAPLVGRESAEMILGRLSR